MQIHFRKPFWFGTVAIGERRIENVVFYSKNLVFRWTSSLIRLYCWCFFRFSCFFEGFLLQLFVYSATRAYRFLYWLTQTKEWVFWALDYIFGVSEKMFYLLYNLPFKFYPYHGNFLHANTLQEALLIWNGPDWWAKTRKCFFNRKTLFFVGPQVWYDLNNGVFSGFLVSLGGSQCSYSFIALLELSNSQYFFTINTLPEAFLIRYVRNWLADQKLFFWARDYLFVILKNIPSPFQPPFQFSFLLWSFFMHINFRVPFLFDTVAID